MINNTHITALVYVSRELCELNNNKQGKIINRGKKTLFIYFLYNLISYQITNKCFFPTKILYLFLYK